MASGVRDNGAAENAGIATAIHCTNWTASTQTIRYVVRIHNSIVAGDETISVAPGNTVTASTHYTRLYTENIVLAPESSIQQGSLRIFATAANITCSAQVIDASVLSPNGVDLHLVRSNAQSGTQE